jgi:hypothetical protein
MVSRELILVPSREICHRATSREFILSSQPRCYVAPLML